MLYIRLSLNVVVIVDYMLQYLHLEESEVPQMCLELYREYGTTMAGLKVKTLTHPCPSLVPSLLLSIIVFRLFLKSQHFDDQALGYEFDNDEFHSYIHGRLPYDVLKPDVFLRNLLSSLPQRKIVCQFPT